MIAAEASHPNDPVGQMITRESELSLGCLRQYRAFETLEHGKPWHRSVRVRGGVGNAGQLSEGLKQGNENVIREGHCDVSWSVYCGIYEYGYGGQDLPAFIDLYRTNLVEYEGIHDVLELRAEMPLVAIAGQRFADGLDGVRTLENPGERFLESQASLLCLANLCVEAANWHYAFNIDPNENFETGMKLLSMKIPLQSIYSKLEQGKLEEQEARSQADQLARYGASLGLGRSALEVIWQKAPRRVKRTGSVVFELPGL